MKKERVCGCMALVLGMALLTGCGGGATAAKLDGTGNTVDKVLQAEVAAADGAVENAETDRGTDDGAEKNSNMSAETAVSEGNAVNDTNSGAQAAENDGYSTERVDIDLTVMSSDMIYATVNQLMMAPEDYEGKVIRMKGNYYNVWFDATRQYYHYAIIQDAAACCSQGLEFVWGDGTHALEEYPEKNAEVIVTGVFETYQEEGDANIYCHLKDAVVEV